MSAFSRPSPPCPHFVRVRGHPSSCPHIVCMREGRISPYLNFVRMRGAPLLDSNFVHMREGTRRPVHILSACGGYFLPPDANLICICSLRLLIQNSL